VAARLGLGPAVAALAAAPLLVAGLIGCGSSHRTVNIRLQSDPQLERRAESRYREIVARLQPSAREKLKRASRSSVERLGACPDAEDAAVIARQEVERVFERPTESQADLLTLAVLAGLNQEVASGRFDQLGDLDEMAQLRLQMAMDRRSKMMSTLSNLMKKLADTSAALVQNLK